MSHPWVRRVVIVAVFAVLLAAGLALIWGRAAGGPVAHFGSTN